jgi:hypothetical protein
VPVRAVVMTNLVSGPVDVSIHAAIVVPLREQLLDI